MDGAATLAVIHLYRSYKTEQFINHSKIEADAQESKLKIENAIRNAGQSPIGQKLISNLMKSDDVRFVETQNGSQVLPGTNTIEVDVSDISNPEFPDSGITIIHEMGHTIGGGYGYDATQEYLNVRDTENRYRWWMGMARRSVYEQMYTGESIWHQDTFSIDYIKEDTPVPRIRFWDFLLYPSY